MTSQSKCQRNQKGKDNEKDKELPAAEMSVEIQGNPKRLMKMMKVHNKRL